MRHSADRPCNRVSSKHLKAWYWGKSAEQSHEFPIPEASAGSHLTDVTNGDHRHRVSMKVTEIFLRERGAPESEWGCKDRMTPNKINGHQDPTHRGTQRLLYTLLLLLRG